MFYYSSLNDGHGEMEEKTKKNEDVTFGNYCPLPQYFTMFESPRTQNPELHGGTRTNEDNRLLQEEYSIIF
jgi:hypothetical protein